MRCRSKEIAKNSEDEKNAGAANLRNMALTTVEGAGLGLLGIGLPDIVIFTGMLMKGVYEAALHYGFDYDSPQERLFILEMMEASLSRGEERVHMNHEVDTMCAALPLAEEARTCCKSRSIGRQRLLQLICFCLNLFRDFQWSGFWEERAIRFIIEGL